jgi:hypothetical protein
MKATRSAHNTQKPSTHIGARCNQPHLPALASNCIRARPNGKDGSACRHHQAPVQRRMALQQAASARRKPLLLLLLLLLSGRTASTRGRRLRVHSLKVESKALGLAPADASIQKGGEGRGRARVGVVCLFVQGSPMPKGAAARQQQAGGCCNSQRNMLSVAPCTHTRHTCASGLPPPPRSSGRAALTRARSRKWGR